MYIMNLFNLTCTTFMICVLSSVNAYGLYGGYERVFYYYAYLADAKIHNDRPKSIAAGCSNSGKCDYDNFIKFVNGLGQVPKVLPPTSSDIHKAAKFLDDNGFTTEYNTNKLYNKANDLANLFEEVSTRVVLFCTGFLTISIDFLFHGY